MFRRSGDPQQSLRKTFGRCLRMVSETLDINYEVIIATLAASTGDLETYRQALLEFLQDQAAMSPVVAAGLYSIGSGDIKGIQELAELLDIDAVMAEGLVALAAGTPATTRGCLPGLLNSLEVEEDKGMAILGLCSDDPQSIASLARCLTEARPDQTNALLNSLVCLPGLTSNSRVRISQALDGLQSNSKLSIKNMTESVSGLLLVRGNTLAVRTHFGMTKLELDLAVLVTHLFKFNASSFCVHPDVAYEPAQSWRKHMPGQYCSQSDAAPEELGAETLFAHLQSGKLPNLFQRVAEALGMVDYMQRSTLRVVHEKDEPQHGARPWDMSAIGTLMTGFFYAGITSRKSRLMEALDLDMHYLQYLEMILEAPGGFREVLELAFGRNDAVLQDVINGARSAEKKPMKRQSSVQNDEIQVKYVVSHILQRIIKVPAQLLVDAPKEVDPVSYKELQHYLRERLCFDCKNSLKFLMFVYRFGVFNLTPPSVSADHQSTANMQLTLRWAYHDGQRYCIERPTSADERTQSFMKDVDWDKVGSVETVNNWRAAYFLAAQLIATCLVSFDDDRSESEFDVVNDGANEDYTNALRFRKTEGNTAVLERRRITAVTVTDIEAVMTSAHEVSAHALARQTHMDAILRILEVADNITSSSVSAYGPMFGGFVLGLVWNDVSGGHHQFMEKAATMLALPANCADVLLALSARDLSHPIMLPRFDSTFSPAASMLAPENPKFQIEGDAGPGELKGCPPRICTDASGVPLTKVPVPGRIDRFFKEMDVSIDQMESMYHLVRVAMGDRAFLSLNSRSVCTKLKVNAATCFGLCAGAFLRGTNAYAAPDMNRVLSSVDRLAADLGVNDRVAAMAVCAAAGNIHQLRELAISLSTWRLTGAKKQAVNLEAVRKEGLIRGVIGLVTGEVKGQLLKACRISPKGDYLLDNIDLVCHDLIVGVYPQGTRKHQFYLRCIAGLALANRDLVACSNQLLPGASRLRRLAPDHVEAERGIEENFRPIIQRFETAIIPVTRTGTSKKYRRLFAGLLNIRLLEPHLLVNATKRGTSNVGQASSWIEHVVSESLWEVKKDLDLRAAKGGAASFGNLAVHIVLCFSGNQVNSKKSHGLVPTMNLLRPDHVGNADQLSLWRLFSRMSQNKLGRLDDDAKELEAFSRLLRHCYDNSATELERAGADHSTASTTGSGVRVADDGRQLTVTAGGGGYSVGDVILCSGDGQLADSGVFAKVLKTSTFTLSDAATKCMLLMIGEGWGALSGIARDVVSSQLQINPPPARRINPRQDPEDTPGWKLLRKTNSRTLPMLTVGSGRRPLLALRRLRAFINLGKHTIVKVKASEFKAVDSSLAGVLAENGKPMATMATEVFAMFEGTAIPAGTKQSLLMLISLLNRDVTRIIGVWKSNPFMLSASLQGLLKPAIDGANADGMLRRIMKAAKAARQAQPTPAAPAEEQPVADVDGTGTPMGEAAELDAAGGRSQRLSSSVSTKSAGPHAAASKPVVESSKWEMIREMVNTVLTEYQFDEADSSDPSSGPRRARLKAMLGDGLSELGDLVAPLEDTSNCSAAKDVLTNTFDRLVNDATDELFRMTKGASREDISIILQKLTIPPVGGMTDGLSEQGEASADKDVPPTNDKDRDQFLVMSSAMVDFLCKLKRLNGHPKLCRSLQDVIKTHFKAIKSVTASSERKYAYLQGEVLGILLADGGFAQETPELGFLDRPEFWSSAADLFVAIRSPPDHPETVLDPKTSTTENLQWGSELAARLQMLLSVCVSGGLLAETLPTDEVATLTKVESTLKQRVLNMAGTMRLSETRTWYREMCTQMLVHVEEDDFGFGGGQNPLLGTAMYMFDVWTFMPTAASGKAGQSSIYSMRLLFKTGVQLAVESTVRRVKKSKRRKEAATKIAIGHAYVTALFEIPRAIAGAHTDLWDEKGACWKPQLVVKWGEMTLRLLICAYDLADQIETARGIPQELCASELLAVFRTLRQTRNNYGSALALSRVLAELPPVVPAIQNQDGTITVDLDTPSADSSSTSSRKRPRTPAATFVTTFVALLRHLKYRQIVSTEKIAVAMSIATALYVPGDTGDGDIPRDEFRPRAARVLDVFQHWLQLDVATTDKDLNTLGIPLYALFLSTDVLRDGIVGNNLCHQVLERHHKRQLSFEDIFSSEDTLSRFINDGSEVKAATQDIHVAFAVKYFPVADGSDFGALLSSVLLEQAIDIDTVLALMGHPLAGLVPEDSLGGELQLRSMIDGEACGLVARIPQINLNQAIAQAKESSRPLLRMVSNAITKIMLWGLTSGRSTETLRTTLVELTGDMLPKMIRPHMTLPLVDMLNGDMGLVTLVRSDIGEAAKKERCKTMVYQVAVAIGMYVNGLSEAASVRAVDVMVGMADVNTTLTHNSKLDTLVNEQKLLEMSSRVTLQRCSTNGVRTSTVAYLLTLIRAIYRARWLYNNANFARYNFEPDADEKVPGHIAARGMCLLMECRATISKYHSSATRAILLICSMCASWTQLELQPGERQDVRTAFRFKWQASQEARSEGFVDPARVLQAFDELFVDLDRLVSPLMNEWDPNKRYAEHFTQSLTTEQRPFEQLRDAVRAALLVDATQLLLSVSDKGTGLDSTVDQITAIHPKLDPLNKALKIFFREAVGCRLRPQTLAALLMAIARVPLVVKGEMQNGPTSTQINRMVDQVVPSDPANWPQYGSVDDMTDFVIDRSNLVALSEKAFSVVKGLGLSAAARLSPEECIKRAKDSLRKCFKGDHTGRDYAVNVIFPLVKLLNDRWGAYGNITLLEDLLVRDTIGREIKRKKQRQCAEATVGVTNAGNSELAASQEKTGTFPCIDMFAGDDSVGRIILACKSVLFKKHPAGQRGDEMKENADRLGEWLSAVMRMHQRWVFALNEAQDEEDDVERLLNMCAPSSSRDNMSPYDEVLVRSLEMIGGMSDGRGVTDAVESSVTVMTNKLLSAHGHLTGGRTWSDHFGSTVQATTVSVWAIPNSPAYAVLGSMKMTSYIDPEAGTAEFTQRLALNRALNKMLCHVMGSVWLSTKAEVAVFKERLAKTTEADDKFAVLVELLATKINKTVQMYKSVALDSGTTFDAPDASSEGFSWQRMLVLYHRCITSYLWWYCSMRKFKFAWLHKMIYRMPKGMRESDDALPMPTIDDVGRRESQHLDTSTMIIGQFGLLQFARRVAHVAFNLADSSLQRGISEIPEMAAKLMELQRAFAVDLLADRLPSDPEVARDSLALRESLVDTFAIDILYLHGVIKPMVDCIYLNRKLLTGTGLQSGKAFSDEFMRLASAATQPYLSLVPRVNAALAPKIKGQVKKVSQSSDDSRSMHSMSASLLADMGDQASGMFSMMSADGGSMADARSIRSNGSQRSTVSSSRGSSKKDINLDDHPIMYFLPQVATLMTALANTNSEVFSWGTFEKTVRGTVIEAIFRACQVTLESPFVNLAIDPRLRKVIESTMGMALAEEQGANSREPALALSTISGQLIGLNSNLVDGMLAVVNKNSQTRKNALAKLGQFLAASDDDGSSGKDASLASATISGLVALVTGDWEQGRPMAMKLGGFRTETIERVASFISATHKAGLRGNVLAARVPADPVSKIEGDITEEKLFEAFDLDGAGTLTFNEFEVVVKYLVHPQRLTRTTVVRLFNRADRDDRGELSLMQFKYSLVGLADELCEAVLERRGLSEANLMIKLVRDVCLLLVAFAFIFLSIVAFTTAGSFESSINSLLPIAAGVGVTAGGDAEPPGDEDSQELNDQVEDSITGLTEAE